MASLIDELIRCLKYDQLSALETMHASRASYFVMSLLVVKATIYKWHMAVLAVPMTVKEKDKVK